MRKRLPGVLLLVLMGATAYAQTLAQRNWAGSGVSVEPWWRRAVFYRIDPATFQDSDGDGKGDLAGIAQRLDYLQALGVDALILDASGDSLDNGNGMPASEGFDDLARAAAEHHLRLVVALGAPGSQAPAADAQYLALARSWLNQGAAGLYVPTRALAKVDGAGHIAALLHQLRLLTNSFPGGRVLIAGAPATTDYDLVRALLKEAQLTASATIATTTPTAAALRTQLEAALEGPVGAAAVATRGAQANPMLLAARVPSQTDVATQDALQRTVAVMLLASRSAVILEYGQELGLSGDAGQRRMMQWTAGNVTLKPLPPPEPKAVIADKPKPAFEGFQPFIPPPRKDLLPPPKMPLIVVSDDPQPAVVDMSLLPGFTAGTLDESLAAGNGATANVAMEQSEPKSLLNFYRQLIQLHHDNAAMRNGTQTFADHDVEDALVWTRRARAGARTSGGIVVICNLSAKTLALSGREIGSGARALLGGTGQGSSVEPLSVFVGRQ
jgi:hypothetical protein